MVADMRGCHPVGAGPAAGGAQAAAQQRQPAAPLRARPAAHHHLRSLSRAAAVSGPVRQRVVRWADACHLQCPCSMPDASCLLHFGQLRTERCQRMAELLSMLLMLNRGQPAAVGGHHGAREAAGQDSGAHRKVVAAARAAARGQPRHGARHQRAAVAGRRRRQHPV